MKIMLSILVTLASASAFAGRTQLRSESGVPVEISSSVSNNTVAGEVTQVASVQILVGAVKSANVRQVRAVLLSFCGGRLLATTQVDLSGGMSHERTSNYDSFVTLKPVVIPHATRAGVCTQQISVVMDNQWQRDPVNHTNNFNYSIAQ